MAHLYLVRHGRAAAGWDTDVDPGLDDVGVQQAAVVAERLAERVSGNRREVCVVSSPLRRCRETAVPFAALVGKSAMVEPRVSEIPTPIGVALAERTDWLRRVMQGTWSQVFASDGQAYREVHSALAQWARSTTRDTVVFSHFIAINALIGLALDDDRVLIRSLDNASITTLQVGADGGLALIEGGDEADTLVR
jgi:broad specificity phosphatase PhoE